MTFVRPFAFAAAVAASLCCPSPTRTEAADLEAGRKIFETICAACHGPTGRADPANPAVQALDPKPADLSDPLFNSREPVADWHTVVTHGGPALGLSAAMPAQAGTLTEEQIRDVVAYAKTLAPGSEAYPPGELNFFLPIRTKKAFPEDEVVWKSRLTEEEGDNVWRNALEIEKRFGKRSMAVLEVIHEDDGTDSEITEVEIGAKHVLHWNAARQAILSGRWSSLSRPTATSPRRSSRTSPGAGGFPSAPPCRPARDSSCRSTTWTRANSRSRASCTTSGPTDRRPSSRRSSSRRRCPSTSPTTTTRSNGRCCRRCGSASPAEATSR
jgi:mono/diheme cytochrome c family protein